MEVPRSGRKSLEGMRITLAGRFASMPLADLADLIRAGGGAVSSLPHRATSMLVIGQDGLPFAQDGHPAASLLRARQLQRSGHDIEIIREEAFLQRLGICQQPEAIQRRYTLLELGRILGVAGDRLRLWVRLGLIDPVEVSQGLPRFDFRQVANAKALCELVQSGVPISRIRAGLGQLRRLLPQAESSLAQMIVLAGNPRMLLRLDDGRLAEPSGQLHFDFEPAAPSTAGESVDLWTSPLRRTADEWFAEAVRLEDAGKFPEAADAYHSGLRLAPYDPVLHFNLGNVLFQMEAWDEARRAFERAASLRPDYAEAWNNLGSVRFHLGDPEGAATAFERTLEIAPDYADAHYNLAEALAELGRAAKARRHWQAYLAFDTTSPWAEAARQQLGKLSPLRSKN